LEKKPKSVYVHSHEDWSCELTKKDKFGQGKLAIFPLDWLDYGSVYLASIIIFSTVLSFNSKDLIDYFRGNNDIVRTILLQQAELSDCHFFKLNLTVKQERDNFSVIRIATKHKVPIQFICSEDGSETFCASKYKQKRLNNFLDELKAAGTFKETEEAGLGLSDPDDYYYLSLFHHIGADKIEDVKIFNIGRRLICFNNIINKKSFEPYEVVMDMKSNRMYNKYWNMCWRISPLLSALNSLRV
jgi:hypothetical protein